MNRNLIVSRSIEIKASAAQVWDALTNPVKIQEYLFASDVLTDWQPGSSIVFKGEYEGVGYEDKGTVLEILQHSLLKYNYWNSFSELDDEPENYAVITYTLDAVDEHTTSLTWTQEGFFDEDWKDEFEMILETQTLPKVKKAAETRP